MDTDKIYYLAHNNPELSRVFSPSEELKHITTETADYLLATCDSRIEVHEVEPTPYFRLFSITMENRLWDFFGDNPS